MDIYELFIWKFIFFVQTRHHNIFFKLYFCVPMESSVGPVLKFYVFLILFLFLIFDSVFDLLLKGLQPVINKNNWISKWNKQKKTQISKISNFSFGYFGRKRTNPDSGNKQRRWPAHAGKTIQGNILIKFWRNFDFFFWKKGFLGTILP